MQLPARLSGKAWARIAAVGLLLLAVLTAAVGLKPRRHLAPQAPAVGAVDPLRAELARCQALGQAGASDPGCLAAWAESRRRFLAGGSRP
jgi:conjugative transfer region protein TrbK